MAANSSSLLQAVAKIPSHHPVACTSRSRCPRIHRPNLPDRSRRISYVNQFLRVAYSRTPWLLDLLRPFFREERSTSWRAATPAAEGPPGEPQRRSEEHTSELQSLITI